MLRVRRMITCVTAMITLICVSGCGPSFDESFDSAAWKTGDPEARGSMLCDLLNISVGDWRTQVNLLTGTRFENLTREEVENILGPPNRSLELNMSFAPGVECVSSISYNVGFLNERGYLQEQFHMMIGFDEQEVVSVVHVSD